MSANTTRQSDEPTVAELTARLGSEVTRLVRDEIALAKAELTASARQTVLGGALLTGAAVTAMAGLAVFIAAAVAAVALRLPVWAAALIIGGALLAMAGALAMLGRRRLKRGTPPLTAAVSTVREDIAQITSRIHR